MAELGVVFRKANVVFVSLFVRPTYGTHITNDKTQNERMGQGLFLKNKYGANIWTNHTAQYTSQRARYCKHDKIFPS